MHTPTWLRVGVREREREKKSLSLQRGEKISLSPNVSVFFLCFFGKKEKKTSHSKATPLCFSPSAASWTAIDRYFDRLIDFACCF